MILWIRRGCAAILFSVLLAATPTLRAQTTSFRFVSWSDSREYNCVVYGLSPLVAGKNPAFAIFPGDLTPDTDIATDSQNLNNCPGNPSQLITWKTAMNAGIPGNGLWDKTFATKGNHDDTAGDWLSYFNFATVASHVGATQYSQFLSASTCGANPCRAYSFDYGNSHFIGADVQSGGNVSDLPSDVITWMDGDLTSAEARGLRHAFLFWHGPLYYVDGHASTPPASLIGVLNKHAIVAATFHGHEHLEAHVHVDSAHIAGLARPLEEFVTGGAGAPLYSCTASRLQSGDWCLGQASDSPPLGPGFKGYSTVDVQGDQITVTYYDTSDVQRASFSFTHSPPAGGITPQTGWWWDPNLKGTGFFVEYGGRSGSGLFVGGFLYDANGKSQWLVASSQANGTMTSTASGLTYSGNWLKCSNGQSLTSAWKQNSCATDQAMTITFPDATDATITRPDGSKISLVRLGFTSSLTIAAPQAGSPQNGWWWADPANPTYNPGSGGTGYGIEIQGNAAFIVAYVYDPSSGNPIWYLTTSGSTPMPSPTTYNGTWNVYTGGPQWTSPEGTWGASIDSGYAGVGVTLNFTDATHATMTMGNTVIPLVRFQSF